MQFSPHRPNRPHLVDDDDGGDGEEVDAHEDEPDELEGVEEAGEAEDAAVLGVRQREHAQAVHDHRRAVHCKKGERIVEHLAKYHWVNMTLRHNTYICRIRFLSPLRT